MSLVVGQQRAAWSKAKVKTAFLLNTKLRVLFYLAKATTLGVLAPQSFALSTLLSRCQSVPASTCAPVFVVIRFIRFRRFPRVLFSASTCTRLSHTFSSARLSKVSLVRVLAACYNSNSTVLRLASTCSASLVTTACRRGVPTAAQQGAAPDRLQLHSFRSFLTSFIALPAAGELVVLPLRAAWLRAIIIKLMSKPPNEPLQKLAGGCGSALVGGAGCVLTFVSLFGCFIILTILALLLNFPLWIAFVGAPIGAACIVYYATHKEL